jgi:hypothetical protein
LRCKRGIYQRLLNGYTVEFRKCCHSPAPGYAANLNQLIYMVGTLFVTLKPAPMK